MACLEVEATDQLSWTPPDLPQVLLAVSSSCAPQKLVRHVCLLTTISIQVKGKGEVPIIFYFNLLLWLQCLHPSHQPHEDPVLLNNVRLAPGPHIFAVNFRANQL